MEGKRTLGELKITHEDDPREALKGFVNHVVQFLQLVAMEEKPRWKPESRDALILPMRAALEPLQS